MSDALGFVLGCLLPRRERVPAFPAGAARDPEAFASDAFAIAEALHAAVPLADRIDEELAADSFAPWLQAPLARRAEALLARERMWLAMLDAETELALEALGADRLPALVIKGMDLGRRVYARRLRRPMADVDVLVPANRLPQAVGALERAGFARAGVLRHGRFRIEMRRSDSFPIVELHDRLAFGDTDDYLAALWSRARFGEIPGLPAAAGRLDDDDAFVYLLRHASVQHLLESPIWAGDLHELAAAAAARGHPLGWDGIVRALADDRGRSAGWFTLTMLAGHWGSPVPREAIAALAARVAGFRRRALAGWTDPRAWFDPARRTTLWAARMRWLLRDDWRDGLAYASRFVQYRLPAIGGRALPGRDA